MIHLVTNQIVDENDNYIKTSIEDSLTLLDSMIEVGLDTETGGLDPHTKELKLLQLGNFENQVVIDTTTIDVKYYKEYLESNRLFLGQNIKFDLKFLMKQGIIVKKVYDTMLAEALIYNGYPKGMISLSLAAISQRYLNIVLDKSVRGKIINSSHLTPDIIIYGANDVKYLPKIKELQLVKLKEWDLINALKYECASTIPFAYTELCGAKLDVGKWKAKMVKDNKKLDDYVKVLDKYIVDNYPEHTYIEQQGNLFSGFNTEPISKINWASSKQVIPILEDAGFDLMAFDKTTKEYKKSVSAEVIKPQKDIHPIAVPYIKYKEAAKVVSTYGQNVLDQINPVTKRIHPNLNQLGADTGRLSSGGNGTINFQNFPRDTETRACFISEPGNDFLSADYSGQESRIIADVTKDKAMLDLFNYGSGDIHSLVAKMTYPHIIKDTPVEEIKSKFPNQRQDAKSVEFAINYGGNAYTIMTNSGVSMEEAETIYNNYMNAFVGMKEYQDNQRKFITENGYIILNPKSGHKFFVWDFETFQRKKRELDQEFWNAYRDIPRDENGKKRGRNPDEKYMVSKVKDFFRVKSAMEKKAINYRCQGTGAVMFKLATILFWKYLIKHNLVFKVKMTIPVHDEWNVECPKELTPTIAKVLPECMATAGEYFCELVKMPSDVEISDHWIH